MAVAAQVEHDAQDDVDRGAETVDVVRVRFEGHVEGGVVVARQPRQGDREEDHEENGELVVLFRNGFFEGKKRPS